MFSSIVIVFYKYKYKITYAIIHGVCVCVGFNPSSCYNSDELKRLNFFHFSPTPFTTPARNCFVFSHSHAYDATFQNCIIKSKQFCVDYMKVLFNTPHPNTSTHSPKPDTFILCRTAIVDCKHTKK